MQKIASYGLITNSNGEALFIKRASHDTHPGIWELPGGGVEFGEDPAQTVKREVKEETGLDIEVKNPLTVYTTMSEDGKEQLFRIVYFCEASDLSVIGLSADHSAYRWIKRENPRSFYED